MIQQKFDSEMSSLNDCGYMYAEDIGFEQATNLIKRIGKTIYITDVTIRPESRQLVTSDKALDYHTDHHRADLICWYCVKQVDYGGETILIDAYEVLKKMSSSQVNALKKVELFEFKVFGDDVQVYPLLTARFGRNKIYYAYWMKKEVLQREQEDAINIFRELVKGETPIRIKMKPQSMLLIDNGRILHGRTAIEGNKQRFLKRFWINTSEKEEENASSQLARANYNREN